VAHYVFQFTSFTFGLIYLRLFSSTENFLLMLRVLYKGLSSSTFTDYALWAVPIQNYFWNYEPFRLPGRGITPTQDLYLHRTSQHRNTRTNIHALSGIRTHSLGDQAIKAYASDRAASTHCYNWQF